MVAPITSLAVDLSCSRCYLPSYLNSDAASLKTKNQLISTAIDVQPTKIREPCQTFSARFFHLASLNCRFGGGVDLSLSVEWSCAPWGAPRRFFVRKRILRSSGGGDARRDVGGSEPFFSALSVWHVQRIHAVQFARCFRIPHITSIDFVTFYAVKYLTVHGTYQNGFYSTI